ncbi:MAG TPA: serine/threonine-protein kinase, partial [Pirellulaceae bacterium]
MPRNYDREVMDLASELVDLPGDERTLRLDQLCGDDPQLRHRVLKFLRDSTAKDLGNVASANSEPAWDERASDLPTGPFERLGKYRLLRRLGTGGMGDVFEAEQDSPRRLVALKIIPPFHLSPSLLKRFEFEAEILGRLDHPGIARVYEAGTAESPVGPQPYFAMELVRGVALDQWPLERQPPLADRISLLVQLCDAVQHAHQQGVIHRDLKPSNILVTDDGRPKVLDFGVARAVGGDTVAGGTTFHTASGQILGTLQYMSPEQAAGDSRDVDTRSDVYALGVIAYQLLSDRLPYDVSHQPMHQAVRLIRDVEPDRPSAAHRHLRGDLET